MSKKHMKFIFIILLSLFVIAGCNKDKGTSQKIYNHIEKATSLEKGFDNQQQPLIQAENNEQKIYDKIIKLDMSKYDQIVKLSNQALASISQREKMLSKEKTSMDQASQELTKAKPLINQLKDKTLNSKATTLYNSMNKRYSTFDTLYKNYQSSITEEKKMYNMLKDKNLSISDLKKQISVVNAGYKTINTNKDTFNHLTKQINAQKKSFYKAAGLNVK